jgi:splicing factor 3B subunit 2
MKVAQLKSLAPRPEAVEVWDPTAPDPVTLVHLKGNKNSVPVPRHWSQKRKYLQGKRGLEKPPFRLPDFIEATGIGALRDAYHEKEDGKKGKQKGRERVRPKMNRLDINYEILRDAFFRYQTKPKMSRWGDLYYEGKEFETKENLYKPGKLSEALK